MSVLDTPERQLAPSGRLRAGINFGNALLANRRPDGTPHGIAVDLASELAERLGVPVEIVSYDTAGRLASGAKTDAWDVAFLAVDPDRAEDITFSSPYLEVEATYLVPAGSALHSIEEVDRDGVRIAVSEKSAYDLFLTRAVERAELVRAPGVAASVTLFFEEKLDALAGLRPLLLDVADQHPGARILDGRFTAVGQAIGVGKRRAAAAAVVQEFVESARHSGLIAELIRNNGVRGATP